jgi:hypothetical protein
MSTHAQPPDVLPQILLLWNIPPEQREPRDGVTEFFYNSAVTADDVYKSLASRFEQNVIQQEIERHLRLMVTLSKANSSVTPEQSFLCGCCLELVTGPMRIAEPLVRELVQLLAVSIWFRPMKPLIARYLTERKLAEVLLSGLEQPETEETVKNCLEGVRLYRGAALPSERAELEPVFQKLRVRLDELARSSDGEIAQMAKRALKNVPQKIG